MRASFQRGRAEEAGTLAHELATRAFRHVFVLPIRNAFDGYGAFVFAQCFVGEQPESEWMWNDARRDGKVRWSVDSDRYHSALCKASAAVAVTLAEVTYHSKAEVLAIQQAFIVKYGRGGTSLEQWCRDVIAPMTAKRAEFRDQHERRVVVIDTDYFKRLHATRVPPPPSMPAARPRYAVSLRFSELVTDVALPPQMKDAEVRWYESQLRTAGFRGPVFRSNLYSAPVLGTRSAKPIVDPK
jgi:hypothetical protein